MKLCEITSRFFGHGIFMSYFAEAAACKFMEKYPGSKRDSLYEQMMQSALDIVGDKNEIYVLKSSDKTSEIKLYRPFYEHFGKKSHHPGSRRSRKPHQRLEREIHHQRIEPDGYPELFYGFHQGHD